MLAKTRTRGGLNDLNAPIEKKRIGYSDSQSESNNACWNIEQEHFEVIYSEITIHLHSKEISIFTMNNLCYRYLFTTETASWTLAHNLATIHLQKQRES